MEENVIYTPEQKRELGKRLLRSESSSDEDRSYGVRLIIEAHKEDDPEASFIIGRMLLDGYLKVTEGDRTEVALNNLCFAANNGCIQARALLNNYCDFQYRRKCEELSVNKNITGPLVGFDGKPIKINKQGVLTPIDAVLEYKNGENVLTLSVNLLFIGCEEIPNEVLFKRAVIKGILEWEGEYVVFGGQKLRVKIEITNDDKVYDSVWVVPLCGALHSSLENMTSVLPKTSNIEILADALKTKRSFATNGLKWSVNSRKLIYIQSKDSLFTDVDEIMHVAKHEFGHSLGLGDLYSSSIDSLKGVKKGSYVELDSYAIRDKYYNLVMCDHHGPISNNDIEMIILAYKENQMQLYQPSKIKGEISDALGKGN